jgi:hypothetical protein
MRIRRDDDRDEAKDELLEKAVQLVHARRGGGVGTGEGVATLLPVYYRHVALEDIETRSPTDIYGAAVSHYRLALERPQGTARVRVFTPTVDEHGWSADGHTVVEIVTDDMPFLVDSVTMSLSRSERALHLVIHPQLLVQRDVAGNLIHLLKGDAERYGDTDEPPDVVRESWMHVEIDRETDRDELASIEADLVSVLRDVREAVEDWHKMRAKAEEIIAQLAEDPPPLDEEEITETAELLQRCRVDVLVHRGAAGKWLRHGSRLGSPMHLFAPPSAPRGLVLLAPGGGQDHTSPGVVARAASLTGRGYAVAVVRSADEASPVLAGHEGPVGLWGLSQGTRVGLPLLAAEPRIGAAVLGLADAPLASAQLVSVPVLFYVQSDDDLVDPEACRALFRALGSAEKTLVENPGGHLDLPRTTVEESAAWLDRALSAQ